ncbi:hypothetical protein LCM10_08975 [Rossellomorea aquimaris]|uniref:hypothetical protein n=1 Tax=Rossellomorea aquimaris TaxID=189382 RepID=UPI001CD1E8C6|nr:hypothetical protein [Rossellomorea aquimaris]MCA1055118.1 hypothetical protein [Rossellomorea aquimaris]
MNKELMSNMIGSVVKINRGGPEARTGLLLAAGDDYFVLQTKEEGVLYYASIHVKSMTLNAKQGIDFESDTSETPEWSSAADFTSMLSGLKHQWVSINRGGPEKHEGVLEDANSEFITLILNEEVIRLATYHVKSVAVLVKKKEEEKTEEAQNNNSASEQTKEENTSDSNKEADNSKESNSSKNSSRSRNSKNRSTKNVDMYYYEMQGLNF